MKPPKLKLLNIIFLLVLICILIIPAIAYAKSTDAISKKANADGYYVITLKSSYLNTTQPTKITLPEDLTKRGIEMISVSYNGNFVAVNTSLNKKVLSITPSDSLVNKATYTIRIFCSDDRRYQLSLKAYNLKTLNFSKDTYVKIPANPSKGFNYDYYLYIPAGADKSSIKRLVVEPNNTGTTADAIGIHDEYAYKLVKGEWNGGLGYQASTILKTPLLVPAFPRPMIGNWNLYVQALDRGTMEVAEGEMKRVDLQLIAMIEDAQALLKEKGLTLESQIFLTGFSASGDFANRFTILHPDKVKAVYAQGNGPLPVSTYNGVNLPYPAGISDLPSLVGYAFDSEAYSKVAKFHYMSDLDDHDVFDYYTSLLPDSDKIPELWEEYVKAYKTTDYNDSTQLHTYLGIGHGIPTTAYLDIVYFFHANNGASFQKINAHSSAYTDQWDEEWFQMLDAIAD